MTEKTAVLNEAIDNFSFITTKSSEPMRFSDFRGKNLVLYFYPKDNTPGCTQESKDFKDQYKHFTELDAVILGVSRDNLKSHDNFKCKYEFPFELISDVDKKLCNYFNVMRGKSMFGKSVFGIERSTFLIDRAGVLRKEWRKVSVSGHVEEVLAAAKEIA